MLILVIFVATLFANQVCGQPILPTFRYALCKNTQFGNYTSNSTYEANLKTVLTNLVEKSSTESFYNSSAGEDGNASTVYGQYNCRGDVIPQFCSDCISAAALLAAFNCSNAKAGVIWFSECTLRYKNESMYGVSEFSPSLSSYSTNNLTDPTGFFEVLNHTVTKLRREVVKESYFATDVVVVNATLENVYFLVQCSPDLSPAQCDSCLGVAYNRTRTCCGHWPLYIYSFPQSCQVMYDTRGRFFVDPNAPSSAASPPLPISVTSQPTPPTASASKTKDTGGSATIRSSHSFKFASMALVFLMLYVAA